MRKKLSLVLNDCQIQIKGIRKLLSNALNNLNKPDLLVLMTAIDEVISNIVEHGFIDGRGDLKLTVYRSKRKIKIVVDDNGIPFDPTKVKPRSYEKLIEDEVEGHLGLRILNKVFDTIEYMQIKGKNRLILVKDI